MIDDSGELASMVTRSSPVFGPASFIGTTLGLTCAALGWILPEAVVVLWPAMIPFALGLILVVFRGRARRFGVGLLIACAAIPLTFAGLVPLSLLLSAIG